MNVERDDSGPASKAHCQTLHVCDYQEAKNLGCWGLLSEWPQDHGCLQCTAPDPCLSFPLARLTGFDGVNNSQSHENGTGRQVVICISQLQGWNIRGYIA